MFVLTREHMQLVISLGCVDRFLDDFKKDAGALASSMLLGPKGLVLYLILLVASLHLLALQLKPSLPGLRAPEQPLFTQPPF